MRKTLTKSPFGFFPSGSLFGEEGWSHDDFLKCRGPDLSNFATVDLAAEAEPLERPASVRPLAIGERSMTSPALDGLGREVGGARSSNVWGAR